MQPGQVPRRWIIIALISLYIVSLLINLGIVPLYLEEPRIAFITLEMLIRGDWIVPTELGDAFIRKPPFFNWVTIPFFQVFGFNEWAPRLISVLSLLGMGAVNAWFVRRYSSRELAFWSTALFLLGGDIYFSYSTIGEIDIFYSLVTYASMVAVFHFDRVGRPWMLFLSLYALNAIGLLTKGPPSILFALITATAWFGIQRRWRSLFSWEHLAGVALFVVITGSYFWAYAQRASLNTYLHVLWSQSSERTVIEQGLAPVARHMFRFTLGTLMNILPVSLLLPFLFRKGLASRLRQDSFLLFCTVVLVANGAVYWLSPGSRSRYIYMFFPLLSILFTWAWLDRPHERRILHRALGGAIGGALCLVGAALLVSPWLARSGMLRPFALELAVVAVVVIICGAFALRSARHGMMALTCAFIAARIGFDMVVLPLRATTGDIPDEKRDAYRVLDIAQRGPLHLYDINGEGEVSFTTIYYLELERWKVMDKIRPGQENGADLYIARNVLPGPSLDGRKVEELHTWRWKENEYALVRFLDGTTRPDAP